MVMLTRKQQTVVLKLHLYSSFFLVRPGPNASRHSLGAPAVRRSPSARVQAANNTVYRSTLGAPADQPLPCAGISALRFTLLSCYLRHNTSRHARLHHFHVAYGRSQRSMTGSPMRGLINHYSRSKHKFLQIALPLPLPWLAHLCSLTHTLPPLSHNLCSYYHPVTCSFTVTLLFFLSTRG